MTARALVIALVILTASQVSAAQKERCLAQDAVFHAAVKRPKFPPDELRFRYDPPGQLGMPNVVIKSAERNFEIVLLATFTNGSGYISVGGEIPFGSLPQWMQDQQREAHEQWIKDPESYKRLFRREYRQDGPGGVQLGSGSMVVFRDFTTAPLPPRDESAPTLVLFPEFQQRRHISTAEAISAGIGGGVFKFHHCERKRT